MNTFNPWVGFLDRTYTQIKASCIQRLTTNTPEITDLSEGNPLIILLSMFSGIAEILHLYLDRGLRNLYYTKTLRWDYLVRLASNIDYNISVARPSSVDLTLLFKDSSGNTASTTAGYTLPSGTQFITPNNTVFTLPQDVFIPTGSTLVTIGVEQYTLVTNQPLGVTQGIASESISIGDGLAIESLSLTLGTDIWQEVETFAYSRTDSKHFKVTIDENRDIKIIFGDGVFGQIPEPGLNILASYKVTQGAEANNILPGSISSFVSSPSIPGVSQISIEQTLKTTGGSNNENFVEAQTRGPLYIRTLKRFVTPKDGEDLAMLYPGVKYAKVDFCCNRDSKIQVYVGANAGALPAMPLLDGVHQYLDCKKILGMPALNVTPAGENPWVVHISAKARFRQDPAICLQDITNLLNNLGSYDNSGINKALRYSDIIGPIDNLPRIDYANITLLKCLGYARPLNHNTPLNWTRDVTQTSADPIKWKLEMSIAGIRVFKNNVYVGTFPIGATYTDSLGELTFTILPGAYSVGMSWSFETYKINQDQVIKDFSIPVIDSTQLYIIVEPANGDNCQPCCTC